MRKSKKAVIKKYDKIIGDLLEEYKDRQWGEFCDKLEEIEKDFKEEMFNCK